MFDLKVIYPLFLINWIWLSELKKTTNSDELYEQLYWQLDMNCEFSSNNNIWARFYEFLWRPFWIWLGYFSYDRLIGISEVLTELLHF